MRKHLFFLKSLHLFFISIPYVQLILNVLPQAVSIVLIESVKMRQKLIRIHGLK